jgi:glyoxylate/hydroxypyruvate reductase A
MSGKLTSSDVLNVLIASYLEPEYVEQIAQVDSRLCVLYAPELLGKPRYKNDHTAPTQRTTEDEVRWRTLMAQADILYDFDHTNLMQISQLAPRLKWVQATSAGIGQMVKQAGLLGSEIIFTTASGVHSTPLAEFCLMAMLMFVKKAFYLAAEKERHHWERYSTATLAGQTLAVIGMGKIGSHVARLAKGAGMRVIGTKRTVEGANLAELQVDALYPPQALHEVVAQADFVVLITPHTNATENLIGVPEFALMKSSSVLINIARGVIVDELALIDALRNGEIAGAALDVFATEPLPEDSPLWDLPNVLLCPHSASTADDENATLTALFCDNLHRYLQGEPLRNVLNHELLY